MIENYIKEADRVNAGVVKTEAEQVVVTHLVRSSVESKKAELKERLYRLVRMLGADGIDRVTQLWS